MNDRRRTPVNLIAGPLGVGKTTAINHLLQHRPKGERWAVLVNEYGLVGLDAALMESTVSAGGTGGVTIREVAGGCICCSASFMFDMSLVLLLRQRPDRLLIEPTGLASVSGILETLDRTGIRESVDLRSILFLLDPRRLQEDVVREVVQDQFERADVLLAARSDLATGDELDAFHSWAHGLRPEKHFVGPIEQGRVDVELLNLAKREAPTSSASVQHMIPPKHHASHRHDEVSPDFETELACDASRPMVQRSHQSPAASTIGWVLWKEVEFDASRVSRWIRELAQRPGARRIKAVLRTNQGWRAFNFEDNIEAVKHDGARNDSRLELVIEGEHGPNAEVLTKELRACLTSSSAALCRAS